MAFSRKSARKSVAAAGVAIAAAATAAPANAAVIYSGILNDTPTLGAPIAYDVLGTDFFFTAVQSKVLGYQIGNTPNAFDASPGAFQFSGVSVEFGEEITAADILLFSPGSSVSGSLGSTNAFLPYSLNEPGSAAEGVSTFLGDGDGGFVAFSFQNPATMGDPNFGWLQFTSEADSTDAILVDFAYESVAGQSIFAGDTGATTVPLPATSVLLLGGLVGLAGIGARRRKRGA